jgi:hypothetical protein
MVARWSSGNVVGLTNQTADRFHGPYMRDHILTMFMPRIVSGA